jgi:microcystin-dependent protein
MFAGNFAPANWAICAGQLLAISENETLFALIGTYYGGDGQSTFALPDLRGRLPIHQGNGHILAETGGVEQVTLTTSQIPAHTHIPLASSAGAATSPTGSVWANSAALQFAPPGSPLAPMHAGVMAPMGGSQPHENLAPYLAVNFIISLFGIFPSQT